LGGAGGQAENGRAGRTAKKLIEAAASAAFGDPPPAELRLAWMCEQHNTLPDAGGMFEQDYRTIVLMDRLSNIYRAVKRFQTAKGEQIHSLTDNERLILRRLMDMGISING
jgi:hypothetical protein